MEDQQIIKLYWDRQPEAIEQTRERYSSYCMAVARNILGSTEDAEECVNDTWFQAWNSIPPHRPAVLKLFLAKLTRSLAFNRYKAGLALKRGGGEIGSALDELSECLASEQNVEEEFLAGELGKAISDFVRTLPERDGNVFLRRYFFTEPVAEIAKRYGLTANHTMVILSRTRKKLKLYLMKEGYING